MYVLWTTRTGWDATWEGWDSVRLIARGGQRRRRHGRDTQTGGKKEQEKEEGSDCHAARDRYETLRGTTTATMAYGFSYSLSLSLSYARRGRGGRRGSFSRVQRALFCFGGKEWLSRRAVPFLFSSCHAEREPSSEERNVAVWCNRDTFSFFLHERTPPSPSSLKALGSRQLVLAHVSPSAPAQRTKGGNNRKKVLDTFCCSLCSSTLTLHTSLLYFAPQCPSL